jgi:hypothetical protein
MLYERPRIFIVTIVVFTYSDNCKMLYCKLVGASVCALRHLAHRDENSKASYHT